VDKNKSIPPKPNHQSGQQKEAPARLIKVRSRYTAANYIAPVVILIFILLITSSRFEWVGGVVRPIWGQLRAMVGEAKSTVEGSGTSPEASPSGSPTPLATSSLSEVVVNGEQDTGLYTSLAAKTAQANLEILHEVFQVLFIREPRDRSEFGNWADSMNQGASIEGVYHGLISSADYKKLEAMSAGASVAALQAFSEELSLFEVELPVRTEFDLNQVIFPEIPHSISVGVAASGIAGSSIGASAGNLDGSSAGSPSGKKAETDKKTEADLLTARYMKQFVTYSVYFLKRTLGEEALKMVESKSGYREQLALWYSRWVTHMAERNIDFGIPLRNQANEALHYKWALENGEDRVKWEVLNRVHRVLNDANKIKQ
jgi:hypothetical protein